MIKYAALALSLASVSALASSTLGSMESVPDVANDSKQGFHGQVGLAVASMPEYVGGEDAEGTGIPLINVSYNDRFYFKFNRLGAWVYKGDNGFRVGGVITTHQGWESSDGDALKGRTDREDTTMVGINAEYKKGMFTAEVGFLQGMGDEDDYDDGSDGGKFYVQASYTIIAKPKYTLTLAAKVESLDDDMASYYYSGIKSDNSVYIADATSNVTLAAIGTYKLTPKWTLMGAVTATSLGDEIADSPVAEDDTYNMVLLGATYSF
jgi:outer membrane protein